MNTVSVELFLLEELEFMILSMRIWARCKSSQIQRSDIPGQNGLKIKMLQTQLKSEFSRVQRTSRFVVQTSRLFTYGRTSLFRALVCSPGLSYNINKGSFRPGVPRNRGGGGSGKSYACNVRQGWYVVDSPRRSPLRDEVWTLLEREC